MALLGSSLRSRVAQIQCSVRNRRQELLLRLRQAWILDNQWLRAQLRQLGELGRHSGYQRRQEMRRPLAPPGRLLLERRHAKQYLHVCKRHRRHPHRSAFGGGRWWFQRCCSQTEDQPGGARGTRPRRPTQHQRRSLQRAINKRKIKAHAHDHSGATFLDDGKSGKSTRAARESSMIAVIGKLAPPEPTPLDVAYKRRAQLLDEDQVLLQNLALA